MNISLKAPSNWADFEELCFFLWKSIWGDPETHLHGRSGQSQHGVDIYGRPRFSREYTGIQCKLKNANYDKKLSQKELKKECENAKGFIPPINSFIMATTSPRDKYIQEYCRQITSKKLFPFSADTWFWDDIEDEIKYRPDIMDKFYPNVKEVALQEKIIIDPSFTSQKLQAFFTRPGLFNWLNPLAVNLLDILVQELALNAFEHGNASNFTIDVTDQQINCHDNGKPFNPLTLLENNNRGRGGTDTLEMVKDIFDFNYSYDKITTENILTLKINDSNSPATLSKRYEITISSDEIFGRTESRQLAIKEFSSIPPDVEEIVIDISGKFNLCISSSYGLLDVFQSLLSHRQHAVIYLPLGMIYAESLIERYIDDKRMQFIIKQKHS